MVISVTGLRTKGFIAKLKFWWLAVPAFRQAQQAKGNLFCEVKTVKGYHHTLTAWQSRKHMKHYVLSGAHRRAMGHFASIATGTTTIFEAETVPAWDEALKKWQEDARQYESQPHA